MRLTLLGNLAVLGAALVCAGLAQTDPPAALTVRPVISSGHGSRVPAGQEALVVEFQNKSNKQVRGFVYQIAFLDADGKTRQTHTSSELKSNRDGTPLYIEPGAVSSSRAIGRPILNGQPMAYKVSLDLVLFADGSKWGPVALPESQKFLGFVQGIDTVHRMAAH